MTTDALPTVALRRNTLRQHAWAILAITAITLAFFADIDYGNSLGNDDWTHLYRTCITCSPEIVDRSFALSSLFILCPVFKADPMLYHLALIAFRGLSAFLLYLLIWQISRQALFAFACCLVFSTFLVKDSFFIFTFLQQNDHVFSQMLVLLALNSFIAYLHSRAARAQQAGLLILNLALLGVIAQVREAVLPLLFVIPLLVTVWERDFSHARLAKLAVWIGAIVLILARFVLIIRAGGGGYSQGTFLDLNMTRMLMTSKNQLDFAFRPLSQLTVSDIYHFRPTIVGLIGVIALCFVCLRRSLSLDETTKTSVRRLLGYCGWIAGGIVAAWLGFAAFLPTIYAGSPIRTHILSVAGESVALAGAIWLISYVTTHLRWRTLIQIGGLVWVSAHGAVLASTAQQELYGFSGTWENSAYFFRSLANLAPMVKEPTLFVYIENPATDETPFIAGWNFQYGIRYFYGDQATGLVPSDSIFGEWQASDEGIWMQETWINTPHSFGWNEVIFITRETSGRVYILDKLPERFLTAYRQSLYHPFDRLAPAFIPPRIRETFPILAGPDWTAEDLLLR